MKKKKKKKKKVAWVQLCFHLLGALFECRNHPAV